MRGDPLENEKGGPQGPPSFPPLAVFGLYKLPLRCLQGDVLFSRKTRRAIKFPCGQKRIMVAVEQCAPDVFTKDTGGPCFQQENVTEGVTEDRTESVGQAENLPIDATPHRRS